MIEAKLRMTIRTIVMGTITDANSMGMVTTDINMSTTNTSIMRTIIRIIIRGMITLIPTHLTSHTNTRTITRAQRSLKSAVLCTS